MANGTRASIPGRCWPLIWSNRTSHCVCKEGHANVPVPHASRRRCILRNVLAALGYRHYPGRNNQQQGRPPAHRRARRHLRRPRRLRSFQLSALHKSVLGISHISLERQLAVSTACIDVPDSLGRTSLSAAAVRTLLDHGVSPNICTPTEISPLHRAIESHNYQCVQMLIAHGADVNHKNKPGRLPLGWMGRRETRTGVLGWSFFEQGETSRRRIWQSVFVGCVGRLLIQSIPV